MSQIFLVSSVYELMNAHVNCVCWLNGMNPVTDLTAQYAARKFKRGGKPLAIVRMHAGRLLTVVDSVL